MKLAVCAAILVFPAACVRVRAVERGKLAAPCMVVGFGEDGLSGQYRAKYVESKSAGGLPGSAPGGGCGCAQ